MQWHAFAQVLQSGAFLYASEHLSPQEQILVGMLLFWGWSVTGLLAYRDQYSTQAQQQAIPLQLTLPLDLEPGLKMSHRETLTTLTSQADKLWVSRRYSCRRSTIKPHSGGTRLWHYERAAVTDLQEAVIAKTCIHLLLQA